MYYATEELWFPEWELGGPQYENPQGYEAVNPVDFVSRWHTPMLVIHGEQDFRIPTRRAWVPSRRCSGAALRAGCWCSRTRITGC